MSDKKRNLKHNKIKQNLLYKIKKIIQMKQKNV